MLQKGAETMWRDESKRRGQISGAVAFGGACILDSVRSWYRKAHCSHAKLECLLSEIMCKGGGGAKFMFLLLKMLDVNASLGRNPAEFLLSFCPPIIAS